MFSDAHQRRFILLAASAALWLLLPTAVFGGSKAKPQPVTVPELLLDSPGEGQRKLIFERSFSSEQEVKLKRAFWTKVLDVVAGEPEYHALIRPYSVVTDSHNRVIVTDPGAMGIHVFDFERQKYKFISHDSGHAPMRSPQCVAVDSADNIYVTDSQTGKIFIFDVNGKFRRLIGSLKGGEGFFKRPTGIAVDSEAQRIYVADTLRHKIFILDLQGNVLQTIGKLGQGDGEFNFPTELRIHGKDLIVVDAMNFRVQVLDRSGEFHSSIGHSGDGPGTLFRPKGIGEDSEGHIYMAEATSGVVQVFNRAGELLYYFGRKGTGLGEFQLPSGLFVDQTDHIFVVDSFNRRVQVFRYIGAPKQQEGGRP